MAIVEHTSENVTNIKETEEEIYYRVFPDISQYTDKEGKKIIVEISLPGVKKEKILLKALPTWFHIEANRGNMQYAGNAPFNDEIIPDKTTAKYDNGLLTITAFVKDPNENAQVITL